MAEHEGFRFEETLTGFKWMANRGLELRKEGYNILFAFEGVLWQHRNGWFPRFCLILFFPFFSAEAIGFMCGIHVPDKDGVSAAAHLAELSVYVESRGSTLNGQLQEIYAK